MANATWLEITDELNDLTRIRRIKTAAAFDSDPSSLNSPQRANKAYVKFCHHYMTARMREWFTHRVIELPIDSLAANATFPLDTGFNPDGLKPNTFFNVTTGSGAPLNSELQVWSEEQFNRLYPDKSAIPSGSPEAVILLLPRRTDMTPVWRVRIFPNPDNEYSLNYTVHLNAYTLTVATDIILWPREYQHVITSFAWELAERGLGEGKDAFLRELAQKAASDVQLVGTVPQDIRKGIKMFKIRGWRRR